MVAEEEHADPPTTRAALFSLALLVVALVAVVGLAKVESPAIEAGVAAAGFPHSVRRRGDRAAGAAARDPRRVRAARRDRIQTSFNLAFGSAMASIGLTIPAIAVASIWLTVRWCSGLEPSQIVLLAVTFVVAILTVVPGRATRRRARAPGLLAAFLFLAIYP